jgi:hypothetical protein
MCDFVSWIQSGNGKNRKIWYLTDDIIEAKWGHTCDFDNRIGHDAIRSYFGHEANGTHHESLTKIPPEIAREVNNGSMRKMLKAGFPDLAYVKYYEDTGCIKERGYYTVDDDGDRINPFKVGKYYRYDISKSIITGRPEGWDFNGSMDVVLDGKPRLCTASSGNFRANFEGVGRNSENKACWNWKSNHSFWLEVNADGSEIRPDVKITRYKNKIRATKSVEK